MKVTIEPHTVREKTSWGQVDKDTGLAKVFVNGKQAGYVPTGEKDPNRGVFHPLSGFPQELCESVVAGHEILTSSLRAPQPRPQQDTNEGDDE